MKPRILLTLAASAAMALGAATETVTAGALSDDSRAETNPPFGGEANVRYATELWKALEERHLVGDESIVTFPYVGQEPHGAVLEYLEQTVRFDGHTGFAIVKKNYVSEQLSGEEFIDAVLADRKKHLASITVMFAREGHYDPDHDNWFWAKYNADGTLATNPKGMKLGGRVAKGMSQGCIACHTAAPGTDYVYSHDKWAK